MNKEKEKTNDTNTNEKERTMNKYFLMISRKTGIQCAGIIVLTIVSSIAGFASKNSKIPSKSKMSIFMHVAIPANPPFPGMQKMLLTRGSLFNASAIACSLPLEPINNTSIFPPFVSRNRYSSTV